MCSFSSSSSPDGLLNFISLYQGMIDVSVIHILDSIQAFDALKTPKTTAELASILRIEQQLLQRLLRRMCIRGYMTTQGDYYCNTTIAEDLVRGTAISDLFRIMYLFAVEAMVDMPEWFRAQQQGRLSSQSPCILQGRNGKEAGPLFELLSRDTNMRDIFYKGLEAMDLLHPFLGSYDFQDLVNQYAGEGTRVFLVDVGGGNGRFVNALLETYKSIDPKTVVVQDRHLIDSTANGPNPSFRQEVHDFFLEQPIRGAYIYHIRACLHDFDDSSCISILRNIAQAMSFDSVLLIQENILQAELSKNELSSCMDILMMLVGGRERYLKDFTSILNRAGLRLTRVFTSSQPSWYTIEARLKLVDGTNPVI